MIDSSWMISPGLAETQRCLETLVGRLALEETQFPEMANALKGIADGFSAHESALKLHPEAAKALENISRNISAFQPNLGLSADAFNTDVLEMFGSHDAIMKSISRDAFFSCESTLAAKALENISRDMSAFQQDSVLADTLEMFGGRAAIMQFLQDFSENGVDDFSIMENYCVPSFALHNFPSSALPIDFPENEIVKLRNRVASLEARIAAEDSSPKPYPSEGRIGFRSTYH